MRCQREGGIQDPYWGYPAAYVQLVMESLLSQRDDLIATGDPNDATKDFIRRWGYPLVGVSIPL